MPRKGLKNLPTLPASVFTPPNTGTSDQFPLSVSPSTVHPASVIDAHVTTDGGDLTQWKKEMGQSLGGKISGVILSLQSQDSLDVEKVLAELDSSKETLIMAVTIPFSLDTANPFAVPKSRYPLSLSTIYREPVADPQGLKRALEQGCAIDLAIQCNVMENDALWEAFEDMLSKAVQDSPKKATPIILSNLLPPPSDMELSIVKLMNHPSYRAFESRTAALSLMPNLYVKLLPPKWNSLKSSSGSSADDKDKEAKEWKRRIRMYLGPVLEAFGFQRIIFGSSPSGSVSIPGNWYEIARECLAELAVEQEGIDSVFSNTAREVYGVSS